MSYISTPERLVMCISWYLFLLVTSILSLLSSLKMNLSSPLSYL